jgi:hypothetical protein
VRSFVDYTGTAIAEVIGQIAEVRAAIAEVRSQRSDLQK